jgi:hypothetical protein
VVVGVLETILAELQLLAQVAQVVVVQEALLQMVAMEPLTLVVEAVAVVLLIVFKEMVVQAVAV